jgi:hypothetical protein
MVSGEASQSAVPIADLHCHYPTHLLARDPSRLRAPLADAYPEDVAKILGGNAVRVLRATLQ